MAKIQVEIIGDASSLSTAFRSAGAQASAFDRKMSSAFSGVGASAAKLGTQMGRNLASGLRTVAVAAGIAAVALGTAFARAAVAGVKAASNLEEQINKIKVVFRGSEQSMLAWSKTTATAFGISQRAALEAAGVFGNMLVPMGFAREEAGKMSRSMVELAADMASFNNADPSQVLEALRSGLAGESEPLRQFGVFLNEARIKQEALSLGLYDGKGALDASAKAQAIYSLILKDTADAQGDFARTSTSLANAQRVFKAGWEEASASLGKLLVPSMKEAYEWANLLLEKFNEAPTLRAKLKVVWTGIAEGFSQISDAIGAQLSKIDWSQLAQRLLASDTGKRLIGSAIAAVIVQAITGSPIAAFAAAALVQLPWGDLIAKAREKLGSLDWRALATTVGEKIKAAFAAAGSWLAGIDWGAVTTTILDGLKTAISVAWSKLGSVLGGVDWGQLGRMVGDPHQGGHRCAGHNDCEYRLAERGIRAGPRPACGCQGSRVVPRGRRLE
jgi:hypothetical protein